MHRAEMSYSSSDINKGSDLCDRGLGSGGQLVHHDVGDFFDGIGEHHHISRAHEAYAGEQNNGFDPRSPTRADFQSHFQKLTTWISANGSYHGLKDNTDRCIITGVLQTENVIS